MIPNFFKIAWRNIIRQKAYTLINIIGLGSGVAVCLIIFVLIQFHLSFDYFHEKKDRIYRLLTEYHHADSKDIFYGSGISAAIPQGLHVDMPTLKEIAPIYNNFDDQILVLNAAGETEKKFKETSGVFATTPAFFKIFDFPLLAGTSASLKDPNNALITKETAEKYFGNWKNAMGKTLKWNDKDVVKITGVLATVPKNTDFQLKLVIAMGTGFTAGYATSKDWNSTNNSFGCYVLLPSNVSQAYLTSRLRALVKKNHTDGITDSEIAQPLKDVHFDVQSGDYSNKSISPQMIKMLWLIALFILIIACVNFINLATAQAVNRAKEVGIRKVLGSNRSQLQIQFLTETMVIVLVSVIVSLGISAIAIPFIGKVLELPLTAGLLWQADVATFLMAMTVGVTLIAGFYPSIVLSGFNPINALKSKLALKTPKGISLRRALVVFQFIVAQGLIICTLIIVKQMHYFTNTSMGFAKNAIVNISVPGDSIGISKIPYLKQRLTSLKGVEQLSISSDIPAGENTNWGMFYFDHSAKQTDFYSIFKLIDDQYLKTYDLKLVAGRNILPSDTIKEFLVNEALVQKLGIRNPQDALNKEMRLGPRNKGVIVGVLKNYHNRSFKNEYAPMMMTSMAKWCSLTNIKLTASTINTTLPDIEKIWAEVYPDYAFDYKFMDEQVAQFYKQENQLASIYTWFAGVAILLSCLGLYGLASFMAVQRIKEVGIRKVLGASVSGIVYLFSKEFVVLIIIGFVIASPITWYLMNKWLQDYTFRIHIRWDTFAMSGFMAISIALATVSFQLIKAALTNPVKSLRSE
ncbi:ABC transporter permease [Mucilaginibacter agri]|uniref:FtsX-like permease family protein n=1 Tax=Mucilaginibacter agri TaxID=2695265 RepID=A0A966DV34_9SPHI|nr:ABC transporter permease [Mucilaginibacter agri]NCD71081.1 FtsX-like permease family protein [Mucilaginibacter agri]